MSTAPADTWCPRCDDLASAAPGTPCATCAAPRLLIEPPRPRARHAGGRARSAAGSGTQHHTANGHTRLVAQSRARQAPDGPRLTPAGTQPRAAGPSRNGSVSPGSAGEAWAADDAPTSRPPGEVAAGAGEPGAARGVAPLAVVAALDGGDGDPGTAAARGLAGPQSLAAATRRGGTRRGSARPSRWLVVGVLGVGVLLAGLGRLLPLAPAAPQPTRAASTAGSLRTRQPLVVLPTARPRVALPARGPMLGRGASGWMVVEYDGWLWRQPLGGGAPHPVARLPQGTGQVVLSPRGDRVVVVRSSRFHSWQTRVEVRSLVGGVLQAGASGFGPVWSPDGRLAFVAVADAGLTGTSPSRTRHPTGPELHLVGDGTVEVLALPGGMHGVKVGWAGDGHPVLLPPVATGGGLFEVEHGRLLRVLAAGHGALARGRDGALTTGLLRPRDAAGPLGATLASLPSSLAALAPDGQRVVLVTGPAERPRLEVRAAGLRTTSGLPADRYRSVHWSPGGDFVWVEGAQALLAVEVASGRVVPAGPALPQTAELLGFVA
jgi:hypothetical protein